MSGKLKLGSAKKTPRGNLNTPVSSSNGPIRSRTPASFNSSSFLKSTPKNVTVQVPINSKETEQMLLDLEHYKYLKGCFQTAVFEKKEQELREECERDLKKKRDKLDALKDREEELKFKLEKLKLEKQLNEEEEVLQDAINNFKIFDDNFLDSLVKMKTILNVLKDRLYFDNVEQEKVEADCTKIKQNLEFIDTYINNYKEIKGDFEIVSKLGVNMKLLKEVQDKLDHLKKMEANIEQFTLKRMSDLLSNSNEFSIEML